MLVPATVAVLIASSDGPLAQGAQYRTILESYRQGDKDAAVAALTRMPIEDRYRAARESVGAELSPFRRGVVQAVLALHSEVAFSQERSFVVCNEESKTFQLDYRRGTAHMIASGFPEFEYALVDALRDNLPEADDFLKAWYLTIIAHSLMFHPGAISCFEHAPRGIQRDAEMQLAFGAMHESEWWAVQSEGWTLEYVIKPRLETAERAYRAAIEVAPGLDEARLRLGRVLALQGRPAAALEVYREVRPRLDPDFTYLATLFEGDAHQQLGDLAAAATSYAAARALRPGALSGVIAAASLAHAAGRRTEALQAMSLLNDTRSLGSSAEPWVWRATGGDPWAWYRRGTAWRFPQYLARLRAAVPSR